MEKKCFKCSEVKPLHDYYRHAQMADGHLNKCKECAKADGRVNSKKTYVRRVEYEQKRNQLPHRKAARKKYADSKKSCPEHKRKLRDARKAYADKYSIKRAAHVIWGNHKRDNKVAAEPCSKCGVVDKIQAHHEDYTKPLDVVWLCKDCHGERHREINYAIKVLGEDWSKKGF